MSVAANCLPVVEKLDIVTSFGVQKSKKKKLKKIGDMHVE